jgi:F420-dependent oxidoreductase-like protein
LPKMKFGIQHPTFSYDGEGPQIIDSVSGMAVAGERLGFDSFWVMDHFHQIQVVGRPEEPMLEGWTTISVLAGLTSRIKLGTLVTGNSYRHPSILAKMGATLDVLSKGRLFMGIGAAWNDAEANAYGIPFPGTRERLLRLDEAVQIIRKMWTEDSASFKGEYYAIQDAFCNPKPIQKPTPKILIGGSGERFLLKTVAKYGDACNFFGSPEIARRKLKVLKQHCDEVGRNYDEITKSVLTPMMIDEDAALIEKRVAEMSRMMPGMSLKDYMIYGTPEGVSKRIEEYRDAGVEYLIFSFNRGEELKALTLFGKSVLPRF